MEAETGKLDKRGPPLLKPLFIFGIRAYPSAKRKGKAVEHLITPLVPALCSCRLYAEP